MPELDGWTVCRELRATTDDVPILILSARQEEEDRLVWTSDSAPTTTSSSRSVRARSCCGARAILRRSPSARRVAAEAGTAAQGPIRPRPRSAASRITAYGREVALTPSEFRLLARVPAPPGPHLRTQRADRPPLPERRPPSCRKRSTSTSASCARRSSPNPPQPRHVVTMRGFGYRSSSPADAYPADLEAARAERERSSRWRDRRGLAVDRAGMAADYFMTLMKKFDVDAPEVNEMFLSREPAGARWSTSAIAAAPSCSPGCCARG